MSRTAHRRRTCNRIVQGEQALRECVGIDLSRESVPDATTVLKFRRLLLDNDLTKALFKEINAHLAEQGCYQLKLTHLT